MNIMRILREYKKVIENYFFMTFLQFLNSFFYLLIFPYLISTLGVSQYGLYVFVLSLVTFFIYFINYGFDIPALKKISENYNDNEIKKKIIVNVFISKTVIFSISILIFIIIINVFKIYSTNKVLALIIYLQVIGSVFMQQWYFQAMQKMKVTTLIQVIIKIISLPFIYLYVRNSEDLNNFAFIVSFGVLLSGFFSFIYIIKSENISKLSTSLVEVKLICLEGLPYFFSNLTGVTKEQIIVIILGLYFGMKEVAIYDLAMKIVTIPRTILMSLNAAIFPKIIINLNKKIIKKIFLMEYMLGAGVVFFIIIFGQYIVKLLGGVSMSGAYNLSIILSLTVTVWLIVGCYIYFVFVPAGKNYLVLQNQIVAIISMLVFLCLGMLYYRDISIFAWAISLSGICEIFFCYFISKKLRLI